MLNDLLKDYDDSEYVYVIEGCTSLYVSDEPLSLLSDPCPICGDSDWPYVEGYVEDIKKANDEDELYKIQEQRVRLERARMMLANIEGIKEEVDTDFAPVIPKIKSKFKKINPRKKK